METYIFAKLFFLKLAVVYDKIFSLVILIYIYLKVNILIKYSKLTIVLILW